MVAVFFGIIATISFFLINDFRRTVAAESNRLQSSATILAAALSRSVSEGDRSGALAVLRGIRDLSHVTYARVSDQSGQTLVELGGGVMLLGRDGALKDRSLFAIFTAEAVTVDADIVQGGDTIGALSMRADIGWLRQSYYQSFLVSLGVAGLVMLTTAFAARARVRKIVTPLADLAHLFTDIGARSDLSLRLEKKKDDEVGVLIEAFNDMFSKIDDRDRALRRSRDTLEETVDLRTAQLKNAKDEAERANAAKSEFLATMSHEIRTPMNGMMVMAEMLSSAPLAPKHLRFAEIITRSGRGLLNIINDILDLSKIEAGKLALESIPFSMESVVEDVASLFLERAREKGLTIATYCAPNLPQSLAGDPTRIGQIVTNLVNNGLKFSETGGVTVEVVLAPGSGREQAVIDVHVRDTGIGIPADKLGDVFERFTQADQSTTRKFGGTGLGLSISKRLVEAMDGEIGVTSAVGVGSDFSFRIALPVIAPPSTGTMLPGKRIGLAIADPLTRDLLSRIFSERGAVIDESGAPGHGVDLVIGDAAGLQTSDDHDSASGRIILRPLGSTAAMPSGSAWADAPIIELPLRGRDIEAIANALAQNDLGKLQRQDPSIAPLAELPRFPTLKVLAVDDNAVNREVLLEALASLGISATMAASGPEAIERVASGSFDVIFMDCSMPDMDGFEATARIRQVEAEKGRAPTRVVALTAHVTGPEAQRWRAAGMDGYIAKPFTVTQLVSVLETIPDEAREEQVLGDAALVGEAESQVPMAEIPLLAPATLSMFEMLSKAGKPAMAARIFDLFKQHAPKAYADLVQAGNSLSEQAGFAHALKSMCSSAGAARAAALCQRLEDDAKAGLDQDNALLRSLNRVIEDTFGAMDALMVREDDREAARS